MAVLLGSRGGGYFRTENFTFQLGEANERDLKIVLAVSVLLFMIRVLITI